MNDGEREIWDEMQADAAPDEREQLIEEAKEWLETSTGYEPNDDLIERLLAEAEKSHD